MYLKMRDNKKSKYYIKYAPSNFYLFPLMEVNIFILYSYRILVDIPVGKLSLLDQERRRMT